MRIPYEAYLIHQERIYMKLCKAFSTYIREKRFIKSVIQQDWPVQAYSAFCALGGRREPEEKDKSREAGANLWLGGD